MSESTLAGLFEVDSSAADAYAGCKIKTYELVQADLSTPYTEITIVSYTAGTGLTWIIATPVLNDLNVYLKVTTIGGKSLTKQFDYNVVACDGSETITQN